MNGLFFVIALSVGLLALTVVVVAPLAIVFYRWRHRMFDQRVQVAAAESIALMEKLVAAPTPEIDKLAVDLRDADAHLFSFADGSPDPAALRFHELRQHGLAIPMGELRAQRLAWVEELISQPYGPPWASRWLEYRK